MGRGRSGLGKVFGAYSRTGRNEVMPCPPYSLLSASTKKPSISSSNTLTSTVSSDDGLSPSELILRARGKQAIVSPLTDEFSADVLSQLEGVRVIANVVVGFDNIDIGAATERGILITRTPGVNTDTTADFAFTLLLAAARRITEADTYVHSGKWKRGAIDMLAGLDVHSRTLGILGMGRIGQAVARRGTGFDMRVLYHKSGAS